MAVRERFPVLPSTFCSAVQVRSFSVCIICVHMYITLVYSVNYMYFSIIIFCQGKFSADVDSITVWYVNVR